jgi:hypothetical protein
MIGRVEMIRRTFTKHQALALVVIVGLATPMLVQAGLLDKWLNKGRDDQLPRPHFDLEPSLVFDAGTLEIDLSGRWKLGSSSLVFTEESQIQMDGRSLDADELRLGREARVTGHRVADGTVLVHRLTVESTRRQVTELGVLEAGLQPVGELPPDTPN